MADHPISLGHVYFTRNIVISIPEHTGIQDGKLKFSPENRINVEENPSDSGTYAVSMRCRLNPDGDPADPYIIDVECVGKFKADPKLSKEEALKGITITANSVLYGAIRESVAWITGRHPHGPLILGLSVLQTVPKPTQ